MITKQFLVMLVFCVLITSTIPIISAAQGRERERVWLNLNRVGNIIQLIDEDSRVSIVKFKSDSFPKSKHALSGFWIGDDGKSLSIKVQGKFTLEKNLYGMSPPVGYYKEQFPLIKSWRFIDSDPVYQRLSPLLVFSDETIFLLAILPKKNAKNLLTAHFVGPLPPKDVSDLIDVGTFLAKHPFPKIDQENAEALLLTPNPWKIYLGLVRLKDLEKLSPAHFEQALKSLPESHVKAAVDDMFLTARTAWDGDKEIQKDLTKSLGTFFATTEPEKQQRILKAVNKELDYILSRKAVNLPELQAAARKYRATIVDDPRQAGVVQELDTLLKLP
jgi:hypothetical protein